MRMQDVCQALCALMRTRGIPALLRYPDEGRRERDKPLVVVSLRDMESKAPGFGNYVGERVSLATNAREELFAQRVTLGFSLDIYSPRTCGEAGIWDLMEGLMGLLPTQMPEGLSLQKLVWKDMTYDRSCDMFCRAGSLICELLLMQVRAEDGSFLDFEVKGGMTLA